MNVMGCGIMCSVSRNLFASSAEKGGAAHEMEQSVNLCLRRVAVLDVASHQTKHISFFNSSMHEEPHGSGVSMTLLPRVCCRRVSGFLIDETGEESRSGLLHKRI